MTENEAKAAGVTYGKGVFPWAASGRSLSLGRDEGITKLIFDRIHRRVHRLRHRRPECRRPDRRSCPGHRDGCRRRRHRLTIHPHPTLSETVGFAAEAFEGTITDLYMPKKKKEEGDTHARISHRRGRSDTNREAHRITEGLPAMELGGFAIEAALERPGSAGTRSTSDHGPRHPGRAGQITARQAAVKGRDSDVGAGGNGEQGVPVRF